jgi:branched-chain amino acid transport system substrate-binding protein
MGQIGGMMRSKFRWVAAATAISMLAAACGSSKASSSTGSSSSGHSYTIGVLTDLTGITASSNESSVQGVQAGIRLAQREGYNIKYVVADTGSSVSGAQNAAHKLVEVDHVFAVLAVSTFMFAAAPFLTSHGIPVVGESADGPEWLTAKNMFAPFGPQDGAKVATTHGLILKRLGGTVVGSVGYAISSSANAAKAFAQSAQDEGLKLGYLNTVFPLAGTNVQPVAFAMKNAGVDAFAAPLATNATLALLVALQEVGVKLKASILFTGYGGDLLQAGPGALQNEQGAYFEVPFEPIELHTAATEQLSADMKAVGVTTDPTFSEYQAYTSVDLLVQGLKNAGSKPTQAGLIAGLNGLKAYDAAGLLGPHTVNMAARTGVSAGVDNCIWVAKLVGSHFDLVPGMEPICGSDTGKRVASN